jgi:hypothetical protein
MLADVTDSRTGAVAQLFDQLDQPSGDRSEERHAALVVRGR